MDLTNIEYIDIFWLMSITLDKTPFWTDWNSFLTEDSLPRQRIAFTDNLHLPPTRPDVVGETLRLSQPVVHKYREEFIIVHYDFAIAKAAQQIQASQAPTYNTIFICFGSFHIELSYFGALGHFLLLWVPADIHRNRSICIWIAERISIWK